MGIDNNAQWSQYPDKFYFSDVPPLHEQSPTDQDMLEYLAQTLPDIWMPDPLTQSIIPRPMMMDESGGSITVSTKADVEFIHDQVPTPDLTDTDMHQIDHIDPSLSLDLPTDVFGIPPNVVDEL